MLQAFIIAFCFLAMLLLAGLLNRTLRWNPVRATVTAFAVFGILIPLSHLFWQRFLDDGLADVLWPTSIILTAGQINDVPWEKSVVFGMAVLSNVGLYAVFGFVIGQIWCSIQARHLDV